MKVAIGFGGPASGSRGDFEESLRFAAPGRGFLQRGLPARRTCLFGSEAAAAQRIRRYRDAGITTLRLEPLGEDTRARLDTLGRAVELVHAASL